MSWLRKNQKLVFWITAVTFIAGGVLMGFGSYFSPAAKDTVADVNGEKVKYSAFLKFYQRVMDNYGRQHPTEEMTDAIRQQLKTETLQSLLQDEVMRQAAAEIGIAGTDQELRLDIANTPAFQRDGRFEPQQYVEFLRSYMRTSPSGYEADRRQQLAISKLRYFILEPVQVTEKEVVDEYFRRNRSMAAFPKEREAFRETLLGEKRTQVFRLWFQKLAEKARVRVFLDEIEKSQGGAAAS